MKMKMLIPAVILQGNESDAGKYLKTVQNLEAGGADGVLLWDGQPFESDREDALIRLLSQMSGVTDIPLLVHQVFCRFEDIKKIIYAGAAGVVMNPLEGGQLAALKEGVARFDAENVIGTFLNTPKAQWPEPEGFAKLTDTTGCRRWLLDEDGQSYYAQVICEKKLDVIACPGTAASVQKLVSLLGDTAVSAVTWMDMDTLTALENESVPDGFEGAFGAGFKDFNGLKQALAQGGIAAAIFESAVPFDQFKLNSDGLIPVIVQDYKSGKVLMLAYMNREAYEETLRSGRMTYYSRSRQCLWKKGETSGHYQFVRSLDIDCDNDTILAKVRQIGAACHTGNASCFFTNLVKKAYDDVNPATILQEIMATVQDRREHPKEGSYTNYLFDKGLDKILKKVGEEATEIVIAAKNPDAAELKYEISDFLYHMIVLMADRGVTWDEISKELAKRH